LRICPRTAPFHQNLEFPKLARLGSAILRKDGPLKFDVKRFVKLAISLLYFTTRAIFRSMLRLAGRSPVRELVILYYHGIPDTYRSDFIRQLESIRRRAQVLPAAFEGSLPSGLNVAITFDDAYVSVAENALPALASHNFHSTIFVPSSALGAHPEWAMEDDSPDSAEIVMSAERLVKLPSRLVTLGSHSCTHPRLSRIDPSKAQNEIESSRIELQDLTAQDIRLFAFPYGDHNASVVKYCKAAGYRAAFSTIPTCVDTTKPGYVRGRVKVDPFDGRLEFFLKYNGAYAWAAHVASLKARLRNSKSQRDPAG
jgi:peptidoglycan/xylan/chitin deacetylase (PgdA/CDA1 family)